MTGQPNTGAWRTRLAPFASLKRYGNGKWATSKGRALDLRLGPFYLFIDFGRILRDDLRRPR